MGSWRVDEVDARTSPEERLLLLHEIEHACLSEIDPAAPGRDAAEAVAFFRHPPETQTNVHWLAGDVGSASLYVHSPTAVFAHIFVVPAARRRGVGSALLEAVLERSRELGVQRLNGDYATPAGASFARFAGAVEAQRVVASRLELERAELAEPRVPAGWQLETWIGRVPDEHVDAYARARTAMDDAPGSAALGIPLPTVERIRASEESLARRGREMRLTVALREGEVGAFTELRLSAGAAAGFTDDTATTAPNRRLGLATAVKLESLRRFREDHPDVRFITTSNDEENAAMLAINRRVGFAPTVTWTQAYLDLQAS